MKPTLLGKLLLGFALAYMLSGCASWNLASTEATYTPGGQLSYKSSKNQEGFDARLELDADGKIKAIVLKTTATTPEAAIAASAAAQLKALEILERLIGAAGAVPLK